MKIINKILKVFFILMLSFICYQFSYTYAINEYISNENLTYKELSDGTTFISGFEIGTKVSEITNGYFSSEYTVKIFDDSDNEITTQNDKIIGTGCTVKLYTNSDVLAKTYTIVVYGDTNGYGNINAVDALTVVKNKLELISFKNSAVEEAGRINENARKTGDTPSAVDALSIVKYKLNPEQYPINQKLYIEETLDDNNAIYVSLYDDGTLVFTATDRVLEGKTLVKSYGNIYNNHYNYDLRPSWDSWDIIKINFADEIKPKYTSCWFCYCENLKIIENIKNLDTSNVTDMSYMFFECWNLTNLDVSNFDTSNVTDMTSMFYRCWNLTNLDVSNFDTSNVTEMDSMFHECSGLTSLDVSNFDTSNVTDMGGMFANCSRLTNIDVSNFDTSNVTSMEGMLYGCSNLTNIDLSNFNTSNVIDMRVMFYRCSNLTNIDLSNFDTSNVTNMAGMFNRCSNLTNIDVSNFDTSNVNYMNGMFNDCLSLKNIYVGEYWTTENANTTDMFSGCGTDHVTVKN